LNAVGLQGDSSNQNPSSAIMNFAILLIDRDGNISTSGSGFG
jgi:hypothetical protein